MQIKIFNIRLTKEHLETDEQKVNDFLKSVEMKKSAVKLVEAKVNFWSIIIHYKEKKVESEIESEEITEEYLSEPELTIYNKFREWRMQKATEENLPAFMILSNADIFAVLEHQPETADELLKVRGFGDKKVAKYGDEIIELVKLLLPN